MSSWMHVIYINSMVNWLQEANLQADGTGWMAFYSSCMLQIAMELAQHDDTYSDMAPRFLDHYLTIVKEINAENGKLLSVYLEYIIYI